MKTALAAAALMLLAAPGRAATTAAPVDPLKWNADTERNSLNDWYTVTIGGDHYLAHKPSSTELKSGKYKAADQGYLWATPMFKVDEATSKNGRVVTQYTGLMLELPSRSAASQPKGAKAADLKPKVVCADPLCKDLTVTGAKTRLLSENPARVPGVSASDKKIVVLPPAAVTTVAAAATTTASATALPTAAAVVKLSPWEQEASATIAKPNAEDAKKDTDDAARRTTLGRDLQTYLEATKGKTTQLDLPERDFIKSVLTDAKRPELLAGFDEAAAANKDSSNPSSGAFIARWRKFINDEINTYLQLGDSMRPGYPGSTSAIADLSKDIRDNGTGATSPTAAALAKAHPGTGRMADAQRKVMAAYIDARLKPDAKPPLTKEDKAKLQAAVNGDAKAYDSIWKRITSNGHLEYAVAGNDRGIGLEKLVDRDTLLDAYCDPNKYHGGAAGPKAPSAMGQARNASKDATTAATSANSDQTGNGGQTMDGGGTAAVNANDPCAGHVADLNGLVKEQPAAGTSNFVVDKKTGVDKDDHNHTGTDTHTGDTFVQKDGDNQHGPNQGPQTDPGDPNMKDHVRSGMTFGTFLGLLGLFAGGPVGLLVLGGAGFALGFGIDMLTNKGKS